MCILNCVARLFAQGRRHRRAAAVVLTAIAWLAVASAASAQTSPWLSPLLRQSAFAQVAPPFPQSALAQTPTGPAPPQRPGAPAAPKARKPGKWMLEIHGGAFGDLLSNDLKFGSTGPGVEAFSTGTPFTTVNGLPSRAVSSWFYGDGVVLFDEMRRSFAANQGLTLPAITPLDGVVRSRGSARKPATAVGGRFSRDLTSWLALEFAFDRGPSRSTLSGEVTSGIEATRASYTAAFEALLATMPQTGGRVTTTVSTSPDASDTQMVATGNVVLSLVRTSRVGVHTVIGGGLMMNDGSAFEARLQGNYRFSVFSTFPINESEVVTIRFTEKKQVPVGVLGFGLTLRVAGRSGIRLDARVLASPNSSVTSIDSSASQVTTPQFVSFPSLTTPSIQFNTLGGARTTLSGAPLSGLVTYSGGGLDLRPHVTVGYYVRF